MKTIEIKGSRHTIIHMEQNCFRKAEELLSLHYGNDIRYAIITDDNVAEIYGRDLALRLHAGLFVFPHGEEHKTMEIWADMLHFLTQEQITRKDVVIALGGGVCGDMAGFAAAARQRGVRFVQIPTSLIAMADSSIGGKSGFNFDGEKNSVGTFYPPDLVLTDMELLKTLPSQQMREGISEIIKAGMIADRELFWEIVENGFSESVLEKAVSIKAKLVAEDEVDKGKRRLLNFGHTFGHAIEEESHFTISHGHAVACGMVCAARLACRVKLCSEDVLSSLCSLLLSKQLPVSSPFRPSSDRLWQDKKNDRNQAVFILPESIGHCSVYTVNRETAEKWFAIAFEENDC